MLNSRPTRSATAISLLLSAGACANIPSQVHWAPVTPFTTPSTISTSEVDYEAATAAINRRDYALALDYLQAARARKADDIRVLNAFGVIYDKLGRFDLSTRYYAQAKAIDQNSSVVNNNIAYSEAIQRQTVARPAMLAQSAAPTPTTRVASAASLPAPLAPPPQFMVDQKPAPLNADSAPVTRQLALARAMPAPSGAMLYYAPALQVTPAPLDPMLLVQSPHPAIEQPFQAAPKSPAVLARSLPPQTRIVRPQMISLIDTALHWISLDRLAFDKTSRAAEARRAQAVIRPAAPRVAGLQPQAQPIRLAAAAPAPQHLSPLASKAFILALPRLTGHPLIVVNASGRTDGAEPVRAALAHLGWTAPKSLAANAPIVSRTTILYAESAKVTALALANTLPSKAQLISCQQSCKGLRLVVGADAANWRMGKSSALPPQRG